MNVKINIDTYNAIEEGLKAKGSLYPIRIFMTGIGLNGPIFGLCVDKLKDSDVLDDSKQVKFIMESDIYRNYGDFEVKSIGKGYKVIPIEPIEGESKCGSCHKGDCGGGCH